MRFFLSLFLLLSLSMAQTPYEAGKKIYIQKGCYSCHGNNLEGLHKYPHLANRAKGYMSYKLKYFRSNKADTQQQEMMIAYASGLSDADIDNLTTYMYEFVKDESGERYDDSFKTSGDGGS